MEQAGRKKKTLRSERGKRGRPPLPPGEGKKVPLNMRTTQHIRDILEAAARKSGRSLTHEVEHRLEQSFEREERVEQIQEATRKALISNFGSEFRYKLTLMIAGVIGLVAEKHNNRSLLSDASTSRDTEAALVSFLRAIGPKRAGKGRLHDIDLSDIEGAEIGKEYAGAVLRSLEAKNQKKGH